MSKTARQLVSQREYARMRGVSSPWVSRLVREGKIPRSATVGARIDVVKADRALADEATLDGDHVTLAEAERRYLLARARLKELELGAKRGELVEIALVQRLRRSWAGQRAESSFRRSCVHRQPA